MGYLRAAGRSAVQYCNSRSMELKRRELVHGKKKNKKVVRYRRPLNINVGMIIFAIIFLYLVFSVSTYLKREKIQFYEVVEGGIVNNKIYTGLILREEQVKLRTAPVISIIICGKEKELPWGAEFTH